MTPAELVRMIGLRPELRAVVLPIEADVTVLTGKSVRLSSGLRSWAKQQALYDARASNPYPVVPPERSYHVVGAAMDMVIVGGTDADYAQMADLVTRKYQLVSGYPDDPVHVQLDESLELATERWIALQAARGVIAARVVVGGLVGMAVMRLRDTR